MQKPSLDRIWRIALTTLSLIALLAVAIALSTQLAERRRAREEADRLSAAQQAEDLAESRARAEMLERLRAEASGEGSPGDLGDRPLPDTVLRRRESGGIALQQARNARESERALARLQESLDALERRIDQSDSARRRELAELRAEAQQEQDAAGKVHGLLLLALIPLLLHLLASLWPRGDAK
jgi:hypothetical protein